MLKEIIQEPKNLVLTLPSPLVLPPTKSSWSLQLQHNPLNSFLSYQIKPIYLTLLPRTSQNPSYLIENQPVDLQILDYHTPKEGKKRKKERNEISGGRLEDGKMLLNWWPLVRFQIWWKCLDGQKVYQISQKSQISKCLSAFRKPSSLESGILGVSWYRNSIILSNEEFQKSLTIEIHG